jgi:ABC transporter
MRATVETSTGTPAAQAVAVTKVYGHGPGAVTALDGVTLGFQAGTFTAVMGPSGSGKSTLLHLLGGLDTPTQGRVHLEGRDLSRAGQRALTVLRRDRIGVVFQAYNLLPPSPPPKTSACRWRWPVASPTPPGWRTWPAPWAWKGGWDAGRRSYRSVSSSGWRSPAPC